MRLDDPLFAPVKGPARSGTLAVTDGHAIHWEEIGRPDGTPVVVLHGGPGGRIKPYYRRLIDTQRFRAVFFDQRGCGSSTPFGSLEANTTSHLISDIEQLRRALGIERWIVMGGSWGSTLGLAYGEAHPDRCLGFVLSGIFLARAEDDDWTWQGVRAVYPDVWQWLHDALTPAERSNPCASLVARVLDSDRGVHGPASVLLSCYETQLLDVRPDAEMIAGIREDDDTIASSRVFAHYIKNRFFLEEGQLLRNIGAIAGKPARIVAGRFDMCTPPSGAYDLHRAWPGSSLSIVPVAGHRWNDPPLARDVIAGLADVASTVDQR
jgi:proline iminopeptidase